MNILVDVDGVMADLMTAFMANLSLVQGQKRTVSEIVDYDLTCICSAQEISKVFNHMGQTGQFRSLLPYPGTQERLSAWRADNHRVVAVTAFDFYPYIDQRVEWLKGLGFEDKNIIFAKDKSMVKGDELYEDSLLNLRTWSYGRQYLVKRPWTQTQEIPYGVQLISWEVPT